MNDAAAFAAIEHRRIEQECVILEAERDAALLRVAQLEAELAALTSGCKPREAATG